MKTKVKEKNKEKNPIPKVIFGDKAYNLALYRTIRYKDCESNCKLCYIDSTNNLVELLRNHTETTLKFFNRLFTRNEKVIFSINTITYQYVEEVSKHFTLISCVKIPLGYEGDFQYHCIFFTNCEPDVREAEEYWERLEDEEVELIN